MFKISFLRVLILLCSLILAAPSHAVSNEIVSEGIHALKQSRYAEAIDAFLLARAQGIETDQLNYNLGIAYYKSTHYVQADLEFQKISASSVLYSMALFNLGLSAIKQDKPEEARRFFRQVESVDRGGKAGQLAVLMLDRLDQEQLNERWFSKGFGLVLLEMGSEDKSVSPEDNGGSVSRQYNQYVDVLAFTSVNLFPGKVSTLSSQLSFFGMHNLQTSEYDLMFATLDVLKGFRALSLENNLSLGATVMQLGSDPYSANYHFGVQSEKQIQKNTKAKFQYVFYVHQSLSSQYARLDGNQHRLKLQLEHALSQHKFSYGYEFESNDRDDASGASYRSYSPIRHKGWLDLTFYKNWNVTPRVKLEYRDSRYPAIDGGSERNDQRYLAQLTAAYAINKVLTANLDYVYTLNESNTTGYSYRRNEVVLGMEYLF